MLELAPAAAFVERLLGMMPTYPTYFGHMRAINQRGPRVLGGLPQLAALSPAEVQRRMAQGDAVVDMRRVADYLEAHIPGVYHVELRDAFASWVGWVVPFGASLVLVSRDTAGHEEAVRQLIRIGYDDLSGYLDGGMAAWQSAGLPVRSLPSVPVAEVRERLERQEPLTVLDVRQDAEWQAGHIPGAAHIEAGALATRRPSGPLDTPLLVHCGHEQRAATALSLLERQGYTDLHLVRGGWGAWSKAAFPVARPEAVSPE
jgi:hydroxyacylglutathione hydrolase